MVIYIIPIHRWVFKMSTFNEFVDVLTVGNLDVDIET
jgi:hypothetical protein